MKVDPLTNPDIYKYMIVRPYGDTRYSKTLNDAKAKMRADLEKLQYTWEQLNYKDGQIAILEAMEAVDRLNDDGGRIHAVVDPYTNMTYKAELILRTPV